MDPQCVCRIHQNAVSERGPHECRACAVGWAVAQWIARPVGGGFRGCHRMACSRCRSGFRGCHRMECSRCRSGFSRDLQSNSSRKSKRNGMRIAAEAAPTVPTNPFATASEAAPTARARGSAASSGSPIHRPVLNSLCTIREEERCAMDFENKVAIVTGAGGGLSTQPRDADIARGAKVVVNDLGRAPD